MSWKGEGGIGMEGAGCEAKGISHVANNKKVEESLVPSFPVKSQVPPRAHLRALEPPPCPPPTSLPLPRDLALTFVLACLALLPLQLGSCWPGCAELAKSWRSGCPGPSPGPTACATFFLSLSSLIHASFGALALRKDDLRKDAPCLVMHCMARSPRAGHRDIPPSRCP